MYVGVINFNTINSSKSADTVPTIARADIEVVDMPAHHCGAVCMCFKCPGKLFFVMLHFPKRDTGTSVPVPGLPPGS
jgi:hypothetical protein